MAKFQWDEIPQRYEESPICHYCQRVHGAEKTCDDARREEREYFAEREETQSPEPPVPNPATERETDEWEEEAGVVQFSPNLRMAVPWLPAGELVDADGEEAQRPQGEERSQPGGATEPETQVAEKGQQAAGEKQGDNGSRQHQKSKPEFENFCQAELARFCGCSPMFVSKVMRGLANPGVDTLWAMSQYFGESMDSIYGRLKKLRINRTVRVFHKSELDSLHAKFQRTAQALVVCL